ncbi:HD domain-containing protein [Salinirubellus salinus]|uniref:HD domain-containing protein n=1 Tax=Salinirubellus salinus TaxID=1364945 RepID=A0A9E7R4P3_9EURY|nr:HD domain-containing protein [Salinirubellus salinus]UWM55507.1 HD domain-containing protein [Salinirubellus salinus]
MDHETVREVFPEADEIGDPALREGVLAAWAGACEDAGVETAESLRALPWLPPVQRALGVPADAERLVPHVRDVTAGAVSLAGALVARRETAVDTDLLVAGALVHDVSKLVEFDGMDATRTYDLLGHPYWGVHVVARAGLPVELAHVVLSHTSRTDVDPAFLEAELVRRADEAAANAIRLAYVDDLREA